MQIRPNCWRDDMPLLALCFRASMPRLAQTWLELRDSHNMCCGEHGHRRPHGPRRSWFEGVSTSARESAEIGTLRARAPPPEWPALSTQRSLRRSPMDQEHRRATKMTPSRHGHLMAALHLWSRAARSTWGEESNELSKQKTYASATSGWSVQSVPLPGRRARCSNSHARPPAPYGGAPTCAG